MSPAEVLKGDTRIKSGYDEMGRTTPSVRLTALALAVSVPLGLVLLNLAMGQDANWDLRNYHWYNAYSFLNGRFFFDVVPAQTPSFYNPTLDVPFFLLGNAVPAPVAYSVLALVQSLNFVLLFALAHAVLRIDRPMVKVWAAAAIALAGVAGGGNLSQIGTTFHDNTVSLGVFGAMLLVVRQWDRITSGPASPALGMTFLAGLLAGTAMGLKQPSVIYCIGVCFAFAVVPVAPKRRFLLVMSCGLGIVAAVALLSGHWMWFLWETHGNPIHPYYNHIFKSPLGAISDYKDLHYHPKTALDRLTLPFRFSIDPEIVGEIVFRDFRIVTLYVVLPVAALVSLITPRRPSAPISAPGPTRWLLTVIALSYAAWALMFCIYRYAVPIEMLAPLGITLALGLPPLSSKLRWSAVALILALLQATTVWGTWGRSDWARDVVEFNMPAIPDPDHTMVLIGGYQPVGHLIPAFPPQIPFVRLQSNFVQPDSTDNGYSEVLRRRVMEHHGDYFMMATVPDTDIAADAAAFYGEFHEMIDEVVAKSLRTGLIDDTRYAEARVATLRRRGGSARAIQAKLSAKGLDRSTIAAALEGEEGDEEQAALALARRRKLGPFRPGERAPYRDKDLAALARAGFRFDVARRIVDGEFEEEAG